VKNVHFSGGMAEKRTFFYVFRAEVAEKRMFFGGNWLKNLHFSARSCCGSGSGGSG
jgi:hypothetical protein